MITGPVPEFFVEEDEPALRGQAQWLEEQLGLGNSFFAKLLRMDESAIADWKQERLSLSLDRQETLRELWRAVLHMLSFMGNDEERVRGWLEHITPLNPYTEHSPLSPPWIGLALKTYLENHGRPAIEDLICWVTGFRFGNPYAAKRKENPCRSSQD